MACRKARWPKGRTSGGVFLCRKKKLRRDKDFRRNEAIYILYTVDKLSINELAEAWDLAVDEVKKIIALHTQYWEATETTA